MRAAFLPFLVLVSACGGETIYSPAAAASRPDIGLFRGANGEEVKLRCGSDELKARIRAGKLVVAVGNDAPVQLERVSELRVTAGPAYGNGRLTFYRVAPEAWELKKSDTNSTSRCERSTP